MDAHGRSNTHRFDLNREPQRHYHELGSDQAESSNASSSRQHNRGQVLGSNPGKKPIHFMAKILINVICDMANYDTSRDHRGRQLVPVNRLRNRPSHSQGVGTSGTGTRGTGTRGKIVFRNNLIAINEEEYQAMLLQAQEVSLHDNHHESNKLHNCLTEFLFEKYGEECVIGHEISLKEAKKDKIIYSNRIKYGDKYYVYRWDSNKSGEEERVFLENGFRNNQNGLDKLNECLAMKISEGKSIVKNEDTSDFEKFYNLYKLFDPKQIYFKYIPIFEEGFNYDPNETEDNKIKDNEDKEICVICFEELEINDFVYSCPACKKIFHGICLAPWLNVKNTCPHCKAKMTLNPKLKHDRPTNDLTKYGQRLGAKKRIEF
uniref:RING-type domain-containing protein n=1 Tax=Meloidogyne javanica TaxID=6303 RepID=A0A915NDF9_MELJA